MRALPQREPEIHKLFRLARKHQASELYLHVGLAPMLRLRGVIREGLLPPLTPQDLEKLLLPLLNPELRQRLDQQGEVTFTYAFEDDSQFCLSVSNRSGRLGLSARCVEAS
jgi:Tfp pilus assembly pilus retraction ATPase PilT